MAESVGYSAGKQLPASSDAVGRTSISGSAASQSRSAKSTQLRVKLPAPFGSFKVGEYTSGDTLSGIVFTNAFCDPFQAPSETEAFASVIVDGQADVRREAAAVSAAGEVAIDGQSQPDQAPGLAQADGVLPISGDAPTAQRPATSDAQASVLIDGSAILTKGGGAISASGKVQIDAEFRRISEPQAIISSGETLIDGVSAAAQRRNSASVFGKVAWPIGKFGFQNAKVPGLESLRRSAAANAVEDDLRRLFCDLYDRLFADKVFDANVLGAAHLGSLDLVRRSINSDGLVLMQGDRESSVTRYLYRAWKAGDGQGRGLHFLRTYLQVLFPNACEVNQLWQDREYPYPKALYAPKPIFAWWIHQVGEPGLKLDGTWGLGRHIEGAEETRKGRMPDTSGMVLTSRVEIALDFSVNVRSVSDLMRIIRSVVPARILPVFKFNLSAAFRLSVQLQGDLSLEKDILQRYPWPGRVVTAHPAGKWKLGVDGEITKLPAPFGSFRVGARTGGKSNWHLKGARMVGNTTIEKNAVMRLTRKETLPPDPAPQYVDAPCPVAMTRRPRRLDGSWALGAVNRIGRFRLDGQHTLRVRKMSESPRLGHFKIIPNRPPILLPPTQARLSLSGNWKLGGPRNMGFEMTITKIDQKE